MSDWRAGALRPRLELMPELSVAKAVAVGVAPRHLSDIDQVKGRRLDPLARETLS
jgi:hypothetical protein